ncbi:homeobox-leucine zipper protein HAT22-like isoform X2 [Lycium barbarum]|uniref:homeobox-leucine zipper protein HAT22-like isoform X2 n=1 Tax=Lycium barbarum TaxID=112863 RepID=UPI00293F749D|nr:homeobox-leucine zipper protein HAT22-like isoform X2 [Lycium barbarum]
MNPRVNSSVSSFSNTSVKRERDASLEEEVQLETNKVKIISPKALVDNQDHDEDVHEYGTRKKLRLSKEQSDVLEDSFKEHTTLNSGQAEAKKSRL